MTLFRASGLGNGPVRQCLPVVRLLCGLALFLFCVTFPLHHADDGAVLLLIPAVWFFVCGTPLRTCLNAGSVSLVLFLPLFLLAVPDLVRDPNNFQAAVRQPLRLVIRSTVALMICVATASVLPASDMAPAIAGLPLPRTLRLLLAQIVNQTTLLADETGRLITALRVRGVPNCGLRTRLICLTALPVIWLLRLITRAERVGNAMLVRGFTGSADSVQGTVWRFSDVIALALTVAFLLFLLLVRGRTAV